MTWQQFDDWQKCFAQEPWGELRDDMRQAANTIWGRGGSDPPQLVWPYFEDAEALWEKHKELEKRREKMGPELEARLKEARRKHREAKKNNGG